MIKKSTIRDSSKLLVRQLTKQKVLSRLCKISLDQNQQTDESLKPIQTLLVLNPEMCIYIDNPADKPVTDQYDYFKEHNFKHALTKQQEKDLKKAQASALKKSVTLNVSSEKDKQVAISLGLNASTISERKSSVKHNGKPQDMGKKQENQKLLKDNTNNTDADQGDNDSEEEELTERQQIALQKAKKAEIKQKKIRRCCAKIVCFKQDIEVVETTDVSDIFWWRCLLGRAKMARYTINKNVFERLESESQKCIFYFMTFNQICYFIAAIVAPAAFLILKIDSVEELDPKLSVQSLLSGESICMFNPDFVPLVIFIGYLIQLFLSQAFMTKRFVKIAKKKLYRSYVCSKLILELFEKSMVFFTMTLSLRCLECSLQTFKVADNLEFMLNLGFGKQMKTDPQKILSSLKTISYVYFIISVIGMIGLTLKISVQIREQIKVAKINKLDLLPNIERNYQTSIATSHKTLSIMFESVSLKVDAMQHKLKTLNIQLPFRKLAGYQCTCIDVPLLIILLTMVVISNQSEAFLFQRQHGTVLIFALIDLIQSYQQYKRKLRSNVDTESVYEVIEKRFDDLNQDYIQKYEANCIVASDEERDSSNSDQNQSYLDLDKNDPGNKNNVSGEEDNLKSETKDNNDTLNQAKDSLKQASRNKLNTNDRSINNTVQTQDSAHRKLNESSRNGNKDAIEFTNRSLVDQNGGQDTSQDNLQQHNKSVKLNINSDDENGDDSPDQKSKPQTKVVSFLKPASKPSKPAAKIDHNRSNDSINALDQGTSAKM